MADTTLELNEGTGGGKLAVDLSGSSVFQYVKVTFGASGTQTRVAPANPLPVYLAAASSLTQVYVVTGANGAAVAVDGSGVTQPVSGTVTVADGSVVSLSSSYTVFIKDVHTADFDTGAGTDTTPAFGIAVPASGGAAVVPGDATNGLDVDVTRLPDGAVVSLSSSYTVVAKLAAGTNNIGTVSLSGSVSAVVVGAAAHDAAVSGNPVLQGLEARTSNPTAVANGDAVRAMADDLGRQVVMPMAPRDLVVDNHLTSMSASTTQTLLAAGGAGVFRDIVLLTISNRSSTAADVRILDGVVGGTERFRWEFAADGGGITLPFPVPFKQASAAAPWAIVSTELDVSVTIQAVETI